MLFSVQREAVCLLICVLHILKEGERVGTLDRIKAHRCAKIQNKEHTIFSFSLLPSWIHLPCKWHFHFCAFLFCQPLLQIWGVKPVTLSSAEVKNVWSYTSTALYVFMAWSIVKHRDNFILVWIKHVSRRKPSYW